MGEILSKYDILGAFGMTIYLTVFSAIGALVLGTGVAILRVSPVPVLQRLGSFYVNTVRNTPLTLILVFCSLGILYIIGISLAPAESPTWVRDNAIRWAIVGLSVYHAAFVCEALREVILPQAFRGAIAPLGSVLIALTKNTTVAAIIGVSEAAAIMRTIIENETGTLVVFFIFALGFVILTLPVGVGFTELSKRLAVKR